MNNLTSAVNVFDLTIYVITIESFIQSHTQIHTHRVIYIYTQKNRTMSIFHKHIFALTQKKQLSLEDKRVIDSIKTRFSLEHFHFHRFYKKKGYRFDDSKYKDIGFVNLQSSCYTDIK